MSMRNKSTPPVPFVSLGYKNESVLRNTYSCRPIPNHTLWVWWDGARYRGRGRTTLLDGTTKDRTLIYVKDNVIDLLMVKVAINEYVKTHRTKMINELFDLGIWREKSGLETPIKDMRTDHIQACLGMIKHHPTLWRQRYIPLLEAELTKRGIKPYGQG